MRIAAPLLFEGRGLQAPRHMRRPRFMLHWMLLMTPVYAATHGLLVTRMELGMERWQKWIAGLLDMVTLVFYTTMVVHINGLIWFE